MIISRFDMQEVRIVGVRGNTNYSYSGSNVVANLPSENESNEADLFIEMHVETERQTGSV